MPGLHHGAGLHNISAPEVQSLVWTQAQWQAQMSAEPATTQKWARYLRWTKRNKQDMKEEKKNRRNGTRRNGREGKGKERKGNERKGRERKGKRGKGRMLHRHERGTCANAEMSAEPTLNQRWQKRKAKERWRIRIKDKVRNGTDNQRQDSRGKYRRRTRTGTIMSAEPAEPALNQEQGKKRKRNEAKESKRNQRQGKESKRTQRKWKVIREQKGKHVKGKEKKGLARNPRKSWSDMRNWERFKCLRCIFEVLVSTATLVCSRNKANRLHERMWTEWLSLTSFCVYRMSVVCLQHPCASMFLCFYVCMSVCLSVCLHVCMYVCMFVCRYVCSAFCHVWTHVRVYLRMQ